MFGFERTIKEQIAVVEFKEQREAFVLISKSIESCEKISHLIGAGNMLMNYTKRYGASMHLTQLFHLKSIALN